MSNEQFATAKMGTYVSLGIDGFSYKKKGIEETTNTDPQEFLKDFQQKVNKIRFLTAFGILPSILLLGFIAYKCNEVVGTSETFRSFATIQSDVANLRDTPSVSGQSGIVARAKRNDKFEFIEPSTSNWLKVLTPTGDTAFVHPSLATVTKELVSSSPVKRFNDTPELRYILPGLAFIPLLFWNIFLLRQDKRRKTVSVEYELDENLAGICNEMQKDFKVFSNSNKIWQIVGSINNDDVKYHGGAGSSIERVEITLTSSNKSPYPFLRTNVQIPCICLKNMDLFFFPDSLWVKRQAEFSSIPYKDIDISIIPVSFIEDKDVPADAAIGAYTYKYTNRNGGPDGRFADNPRIPVCEYTKYAIYSPRGLNEMLMCSKEGAFDDFIIQIRLLKELQSNTRSRQSDARVTEAKRPSNLPGKSEGTKEISKEYYELLSEFSKQLSLILRKLTNDSDFIDNIRANTNLAQSTPSEFISGCILFDLVQVLKLVTNGPAKEDSIEMFGAVVMSLNLVSDGAYDLLEFKYENAGRFSSLMKTESYRNSCANLIDLAGKKNPFNFDIQETEGGSTTSKPINTIFSIPAVLKILEHEMFDEYVVLLNRFATIIAKADSIITKDEEAALKEIFQFTHYPIPGEENKALNISEGSSEETLDDVLEELQGLIGLAHVKSEVGTLINFIQVQKERDKQGLKNPQVSYHCVFVGSPGTGKTTVARIIARVYRQLGILNKGHLVETDRAGLVAEYLGQTSTKVDKVIKTALDGILFIDEAYSLVGQGNDDYGKEAVAALLKRMEDNRDRLVVIVAGYSDQMKAFIETNPGLKSRFNRHINFPDYTQAELMQIFDALCSKSEYVTSSATREVLLRILNELYSQRDNTFGNGRLVRNLFEKTIENQSNRIMSSPKLTKELLITIEPEDIPSSV